jgi:DNA-binding transcriptional ArsR family regulator
MKGDADIALIGSLVADPARARILLALGDGRALAASVLADEAGVAPSTASSHLGKLVDGGLLTVERHGRHRYFSLNGPEVAALIEALAQLAPPAPVRSLRQGTRANAVRTARTCYDHLAGILGTQLMAAMLERGLLTGGDGFDYRLTGRGQDQLEQLGIDFAALRARPRPLIRYCVDWSEQRHHLAGSLGAALAARAFELRWVTRARRGRAVHVTDEGVRGFRERFGVELAALAH